MNLRTSHLGARLQRAFTLIEMVMSMVILSVLLLACGSMVMMATRATGASSNRNQEQLLAADAASQITDDLNVATNFTQRTARAVTFTVPDRLNLGTPQVVSYNWTGTPGDPLLRQFNGGASTVLLPGVQNFGLTFTTRMMGPAPGPAEQVIFSHDAAVGTFKDYKMDDKNWASQYFAPSLPLGTSSYTITRIRLMLKAGAQNQSMIVSLALPDVLFRPTATTLAQATVYESALSSQYEWVDVPFTGLTGQNPLQGLCITLTPGAGCNNIGMLQIDQSLLNILAGANWSATSNAGASWSAGVSTTVGRFYVFGTVP